jgi:periplasmic protein TonB
MNKIVVSLVLALGLSQSGMAQGYQNEKLAYLDAEGNPAKEKKAIILKQVVQLDDTVWEINFYLKNGPRLKSYRSKDAIGTLLNGQYVSYNNGRADTIGNYEKGLRTGHWNILTPKGAVVAQQLYEDGQLRWTKDTIQLKHESDSIKALLPKDTSSSFVKVEIESEFPGGAGGWLHFLNKNLRYPDNAVNNNIQGEVVLGFIVDKLGHIPANTVFLYRSVEYSLDHEALRIIFISPDWTAAVQNGRKVKSYKKQPIIFRLEVMGR